MDEEATCSICLELLTEPVTIECGHNFCRACITLYCKDTVHVSGNAIPCPSCRAGFQRGSFQLNTQLKNLVEKIKEQSLKPGKEQMVNQCVEHEEKLKLFCEEDGEAICVICRESQAHHGHKVLPIQEAANNYKLSQGLWAPQQCFGFGLIPTPCPHSASARLKVEIAAHTCCYCLFSKNTVKQQRERIKSECEKPRRFVSEEEQLLLQRLEEEEREMLQSLEENVAQLSKQSSSLHKLISEIEEKSLQTPTELLKDLTLDPGTAHPKLVLSKDWKCVRCGDKQQDLPDTPERFDTSVCVLGSEGFTGRRHYWEVEVGDKTGWDLDVCRESVHRKGKVRLRPGNGYWAVWLRDGGYEALTYPPTPLTMHVRPRQVGVFLDYEAGKVSFYNMTDKSHLFTFTDTFSGTLCPYFYTGYNVAPLILCPVPAQP
ncbi:E3 ubiquitin-protein ligase TRIM39-like [Alligator mississippiensis]|uniref:E3 ubiquitin-protein ligase TRIM39-like n=1 Tax=Alligator mississippiensis TaxID=8496 RepID=UPI002877D894|nr:E3 ubiquitin-protein ligase TRIM39-like [Alligator mississippiensis]